MSTKKLRAKAPWGELWREYVEGDTNPAPID